MSRLHLLFSPEWETLVEGSAEERACFGQLTIECGAANLTEGYDTLVKRLRSGPLVSNYHLAEWLAWNWWRLRWEPRTSSEDWPFSHDLSTIGSGYVWPNIVIFSDGSQTVLVAKPTYESLPQDKAPTSFRYLSDVASVVSSATFEAAIDSFIERNINRLKDIGVSDTNLHKIWNDLQSERQNVEIARKRKFEALLGADPDEADAETIRQLIEDSKSFGEDTMGEIAANHTRQGKVLTVEVLKEAARTYGCDSASQSQVKLPVGFAPQKTSEPAHEIGRRLAKALRQEIRKTEGPIENRALSDLASVQERILSPEVNPYQPLAFVLKEDGKPGRIVLHSKRENGRRFDLARLLSDQLLNGSRAKLFPATRANTFRQKLQRSFAAEFLAPFDEVMQRLNGDYSEDNQIDAADYFKVSPRTIITLLRNHKVLDRYEDADEVYSNIA